ncbi:MAG TPA: ATP-grasp domain-containing protein [Acidimicrobiales bacterium]|nr:ATP-grasp domain-containing protein [Acidimicrobiales bacterium]
MRLLLVSPSGSYRTAAFLDAAGALGCEVAVATDEPSAIPKASLHVPFHDPDAAAERLVSVVDAMDGVVGTDGDAVAVAAAFGRRVGLASTSPAAVAAAGDKAAQRTGVGAAGVPQPEFAVVAGDDAAAWSTFPAVVKPLDRSASQGVLRVDGAAELAGALRTVRGIVGKRAPLLVESFLPGVEVIVEGLVRAGRMDVLATFDKPDTPEGPTFPETLLVSPARLGDAVTARVVDVARRAVAAVGLNEGPVHVECKAAGEEVWFLELAARTIGGLCARALDDGGVSLEELVVRHALGLPLPPRRQTGATGVLMLPVGRSGRLAAVRGVDSARAVEGVTGVIISIGPGQEVAALPAGDRYLGFVFARAATPDAVESALRQAWAALEVDITAS